MSTKPTAKKAGADDVYDVSYEFLSADPGHDPLYGLPSYESPSPVPAPVVAPDVKKES